MRFKNSPIKFCDRCESELPLGSTKYNVRVEVTSDFDGYLPELEEDEEETQAKILEDAAKLDEKTLEDQVHMELTMMLCPSCRQRFLEDLDLATGGKPMRKVKPPIRLH